MIRRTLLGLLALLLIGAGAPAFAAQTLPQVSYDVGVCDPLSAQHCIKPNADGSINTTPAAGGTTTILGTDAATTNASTTVTLGNTFQTALTASTTRKGCLVQNPTTATEVLFVNFGVLGSATTARSVTLSPGAAVGCDAGTIIVDDAVNITAATTGHAFLLQSQ